MQMIYGIGLLIGQCYECSLGTTFDGLENHSDDIYIYIYTLEDQLSGLKGGFCVL